MFDFKNYERTGNLSVDMVAACVYHYRRQMRALKTIYLRPLYFDLFMEYVVKHYGEEHATNARIEFDGVAIEKGNMFMKDKLSVDFWPEHARHN